MLLSEFSKQPRGPYRFETWLWKDSVPTVVGDLPIELYTTIDEEPSEAMVEIATELATYVSSHGDFILDLIYGDYLNSEKNGWLSFWNVPTGLGRNEILNQVESIILTIQSDLLATIYVNPLWEIEHKLSFTYEADSIVEVNDSKFQLENGILVSA